MIEVSAGVIRREDGRILICRRGEGRRNAHLWEFPGGKREAGESAQSCLQRELREELGMTVHGMEELCVLEEGGIRFTFIACTSCDAPRPTEHEDVRFVTAPELAGFDFCPADVPVARRLAFVGVRHFIWDYDGTLMDTYPAMTRAFVAAAADEGVAITPERTLTLLKNCLHHALTTVEAEHGVPASRLRTGFRSHEKDELRKDAALLPGMRETLAAIHAAGGRHYVATHRNRLSCELLAQAGVLNLFDGFVTEEDGLPRKPRPDMLLHLMARHGLNPEECVMIGDRPLDTRAGHAAGMRTILLDAEDRFPDGPCTLRVCSAAEVCKIFVPGWTDAGQM